MSVVQHILAKVQDVNYQKFYHLKVVTNSREL